MLKDITLGQYFPGKTFLHRLDPRTKMIATLIYIIALFSAKGIVSYGILLAFLALGIAVSRVSLHAFLRGLKPVVIIICFTALLNLFLTKGETVFQLGFLSVSREGVRMAVTMVVRIVMLILCSLLLTYTTSPLSLTDGIEALFRPLKKIHVPVHELAMMMSIALRFIPTLIEETDKIMSAQKARGAQFDTGNLIQKAKALLPLLVPLFVSAFGRADELAVAMECRCYHGDSGRTRMKELRMGNGDWFALALTGVVFLLVLAFGAIGM